MSDTIDVTISDDPILVTVSDAPFSFPQVVEADNEIEQNALFAAGAKIVIRTDLV